MRAVLATLATAAVAAALAVAAQGALPDGSATFSAHDHNTPGDGWHVEVKTDRSGRVVEGLVLHAERCGGHTPFAAEVPVGPDGRVLAAGRLDPDRPAAGDWGFDARFTETHRLDGFFRIVTPRCDTGPMVFVAHSGSHAHTGYGPPMGTMPDLSTASARKLAQAQALYEESLRTARERFPNYRAARRRGYHPFKGANLRPQIFHVRNLSYTRDTRYFDARRPEALVYYRGLSGPPVLVALMYRYRTGVWPRFAKPLLGWHQHGSGRWKGVYSQMTHVWLTRDLRSGLANCMPIPELDAAIAGFDFTPPPEVNHESQPCRAG